MMKRSILFAGMKLIIFISFAFLPGLALTQLSTSQSDSTAIIQEFIVVCNQYKRIPLFVSVEQKNTAIVGVNPEDTATIQADFYVTDQGAYIKYGNIEQLVSDSLLLMVNLDQKVMMLTAHASKITRILDRYMGFQVSASSAQRLANHYTSRVFPGSDEDQGIIELTKRLPLAETGIAKEVVLLKYNKKTKEPQQVTYTRRSLVPLNKSEWEGTTSDPDNKNVVSIKEELFLVNERVAIFDFKQISHSPAIKLPVSMTERISYNQQGEVVPAKGLEHYYLDIE